MTKDEAAEWARQQLAQGGPYRTDVPLYRCAASRCPGLPWRPSGSQPHPVTCCADEGDEAVSRLDAAHRAQQRSLWSLGRILLRAQLDQGDGELAARMLIDAGLDDEDEDVSDLLEALEEKDKDR